MIHHKLILIAASCLLAACQIKFPPGPPSEDIIIAENPHFKPFSTQIDDQTVYGVLAGDICDAAVLFIHGTPGSWSGWGQYLADEELRSKATLISVDRPGFANSATSDGKAVVSIADQASLILESALTQHPGPFVLVGHSYGGPIELQIAMDSPDDVSSMILLAGSADPELHHARWYHRLAGSWLGRALLSQSIEVATDEMLSLHENLDAQTDQLSEIQTKTTVVQGGKDWLAPPGNAEYIRKKLTAAPIEMILLPEQSHFLPWKEWPLVKKTLLEHLGTSTCESLPQE